MPGDVLHLWHGDLADRRYGQRVQGFAKFDFDPDVDIAVDDQGCWRWNADKPEMHRYFVEYFRARGM